MRKFVEAALVAWVVALMSATMIVLTSHVIDWPKWTDEFGSSWIQALGSIASIIAAAWIMGGQSGKQTASTPGTATLFCILAIDAARRLVVCAQRADRAAYRADVATFGEVIRQGQAISIERFSPKQAYQLCRFWGPQFTSALMRISVGVSGTGATRPDQAVAGVMSCLR